MTSSSTHIPLPPAPERRLRDLALLAALFGLMLVGLIGLAAATGWQETLDHIARLSPLQIAGLLALSLVNYGFRGLRWHIFTRSLGLRTALIQNYRHFLGGFAMSVTPGRVGELVRLRWLRRETGWNFDRTAPLVLADRASDLAAIALILGGAVSLSTGGITGAVPVTLAALAAAFIATRPTLLSAIVSLTYRATGLAPRLFARLRGAAKSLRHVSNGPVLVAALALGLIGWLAEGYAFYLLMMWMGADVPLAMAIGIFVFSTLVGGLTGAPGGIGGAEGTMIALLALQGIPFEVSLPATLVIRVTTLWFAIGIGFVVFPFAERISKRESHALENR
ncbi:lysylphosphatidylglycerol synthase transmembrane domain-containing protein [Pseudogemmobacter sp. W21_MBD1_M6]|uniref:lysylphosphatidylglycerol synthase transmembrane domain-containing protein n=1 Tax=Pseudogemmobacter sp. W21_MBD1_M6 TaxID=3240271 RepID=UPI003F9850A9